MASIELKNIRKSFGTVEVIKGVDLSIKEGEFTVFVGPSGAENQPYFVLLLVLKTLQKEIYLLANAALTTCSQKSAPWPWYFNPMLFSLI